MKGFTVPLLSMAFALFGFGLLGVASAEAQQYVISTFAGTGQLPGSNPPVNAGAVATDSSGNVYFAGFKAASCTCVFKLDTNGALTRVAGSSQSGFSGDGGPATSAQLGSPEGLAVDTVGNLYIADPGVYHSGFFGQDRIRKVSPDGTITTVAGGGTLWGSAADGGLATSAQLYYPMGMVVDGAGNLFFAETLDPDGEGSNRIRKISPDGTIATVAGNGMYGFSGDGGPATNALLAGPTNLAIDSADNLFFVDFYNNRIREVTPDGNINTVVDATGRVSLFCGCSVTGLTVDAVGNLLYSVYSNSAVFKRSPDGTTTLVGADPELQSWWLAAGAIGNLFLSGNSRLFRISPDGSITTLVGDGACCFSGDGGPAISAQLLHSNSVAAGGAGNLFIADSGNRRIREVTSSGIINTVAGTGKWDFNCDSLAGGSGPVQAAELCSPSQVAVDGAGNTLIVDRNRIRKVSPDGTITSIAGDGTIGLSSDGGLAAQAELAYPDSVAVDFAGNVYFAEWSRVRKITPDGIVTTVAGTTARAGNSNGCSPPASPGCGPPPVGDGQPATSVQLFGPASAVVDSNGNLYFVDGPRIREVTPDGIISTVVGNGSYTGYHGPTGDGGPATSAPLWAPNGVTVDTAGNLYISEPVRIRKVTTDGIINTIAGTREPGYSGDGGAATQAQLWNPTGLTADAAGNVYFADSFNNVIRVLRPTR